MIYVCDAIMGSGKSSAAISMMRHHSDRKYLYITPYTDEIARVKRECVGVDLREPVALPMFRNSKVCHTEWMMENDLNIVSTHQAFTRYSPSFLGTIKDHHYTLVIDENITPLQPVVANHSYLVAAEMAGLIREIMPGVYRLSDSTSKNNFDEKLFYVMQSHDLLVIDGDKSNKAYYWLMPPEFLLAFDDVYILTYMFEGQGLYAMLKMYNIPYRYVGIDRHDGAESGFSEDVFYVPPSVSRLRDLVHIVDNQKMNAIGDSYYALSKSKYNNGGVDLKQLKKHLANYFKNLYPTDVKYRMWSTFADYKDDLKGNGYASRWRALNLRATNDEAESTVLAYLVNLFMQRGHAIFFQHCGVKMNNDLYALSTMVQWIWRSAIRNGGEIIIYLPSRRMRELLLNWMDDLAAGVDPKLRYQGKEELVT